MNKNAINVMKVNVLDAHDRLLFLREKESNILAQGCEDCLKKNELSLALQERSSYIYLFAHPRTMENGNGKVMYWQPRLLKPSAQTNSYLFRALSHQDTIEICWMIPDRNTWGQNKRKMVAENDTVEWSIKQYLENRKELEANHRDDMSEDRAKSIYQEVIASIRAKKAMQGSLVSSSLTLA